MKTYHKIILTAAILVPTALWADISLTGSGTVIKSQNFDTLPALAHRTEFSWQDDTSIPGFFLHRSNAPGVAANTGNQNFLAGTLSTPAERPYTSDASDLANVAPNYHGFTSLGNSADRALGACPTTTDSNTNWAGGELSILAIYTNNTSQPFNLTAITYDIEVWRNNNGVNNEPFTLSYKLGTSATLKSDLAAGTAGTATPLFTTAHPGYTDMGAAFTFTYAQTDTVFPTTHTRTGTLGTPIQILPGQSIALRWGNANESGTDAQVGLDNVQITFQSVGCAITPAVTNVVRNANGTPALPTDDTVDFDVNVVGTGAVDPLGWKIVGGPVAGNGTTYGTTGAAIKHYSAVPISNFTPTDVLTLTIQDRTGLATCQATASVTVSPPPIVYLTPTSGPINITFTTPVNGATSYVRQETGELGWTNVGAATALVATQPSPGPSTSKYFDVNNSVSTEFTTEGVDVTQVPTVRVSIDLAAYTTSGTGFEEDDAGANNDYSNIIIETSAIGDFSDTLEAGKLLDGTTTGTALFGSINVEITGTPGTTGTGGINFGVNPFPSDAWVFLNFNGEFSTASVSKIRLRLSHANNSGSEHTMLDNIKFEYVNPDSDNDGLLDAWELGNFGTLAVTPGADPDKDGLSNLGEFLAGTNPNDPFSVLALTTHSVVGSNLNLTWTSVLGKKYKVETSPNLTTWTTAANVNASGGATTSLTLPLGGSPPNRIFCRISGAP